MAEWRIYVVVLLFVGDCLLQVCGAGKVPCTVTQGADQTTYSVPDEGASDCSYSWANATDTGHTVLAHEERGREDGLLRSKNVSTFISTECFPRVIYTRNCLSEKEEHTSNCTIVCREKVVPLEDIKKTTSRIRFIPVIILIPSVIVLLVGLIYFRR